MDKLMLIDGNSIIYRAFFAMPPLTNSSGQQTNAVYGFTTMLLRLLEEHKPTHILVAFDAGKITFRHKGYEDYKGGREKTPPELSQQFPLLKELLTAFGIAQFELDGYEADDIIGTLSKTADEAGFNVLVVTGDKDMLQLASDHVTVGLTRKGVTEVETYGPEQIQERYGLKPLQIIDLKGLMGDTSDNIPGIPGVGEKTALKLLHQYGSVEEVLAHTNELKGKMKERVETHADDARMSKDLATIYRDVTLDKQLEDVAFGGLQAETAGPALAKLEFKSLLERLSFSGEVGSTGVDVEEAAADVTVLDEQRISELVEVLDHVDVLHVETHGDNPHHADIVGLIFAATGQQFFMTLDVLQSDAATPIREWLADPGRKKRGHDLHRTDLALHWHGIEFAGAEFDVQLAGYLLDPTDANQTLSGLAAKYGLSSIRPDEEVFGKGAKYKVPDVDVLSDHVARKAAVIEALVPVQQAELEKRKCTSCFMSWRCRCPAFWRIWRSRAFW